jgi:arsenate reductase
MLPHLKILFLCTGNSCRSQMAEAWTRHLHGERFEVYSAGTRPGMLDERAVRVMEEVGVDMSGHRSKSVDEMPRVDFDCVVTVCDSARESCPVLPGKTRHLHAGFEDPPRLAAGAAGEEEALAPYRRVRDEIRQFVRGLPGILERQFAGKEDPS